MRRSWRAVAPDFDALVALDRNDPHAAIERLCHVDDRDVWGTWIRGLWRPWYAAQSIRG